MIIATLALVAMGCSKSDDDDNGGNDITPPAKAESEGVGCEIKKGGGQGVFL